MGFNTRGFNQSKVVLTFKLGINIHITMLALSQIQYHINYPLIRQRFLIISLFPPSGTHDSSSLRTPSSLVNKNHNCSVQCYVTKQFPK